MPVRLQPILVETYAKKITGGRQFPLAKQRDYLGNIFALDDAKGLRFRNDGMPVLNRLENIYFCFGFPLPSSRAVSRVLRFQDALRRLFPSERDLLLSPKEQLHVTLMNNRHQAERTEPEPHPLLDRPAETRKFLRSVASIISKYGPVTIYFKQFALLWDGALIACGYPQNFPLGFLGPSSVDLMREDFLAAYPGRNLDIVHLTVGRLLKEPSRLEHSLIWSEIDRFNERPVGTVTINDVSALYEARFLLSDVKPLARIDLSSGLLNLNSNELASIVESRLMQKTKFEKRAFYQAISAVLGIDRGNDNERFDLAKAALHKIITDGNDPVLNKIGELLPSYRAWTASGAHRFMPLAVVVANMFGGQAILDPAQAKILAGADPQFRYLTDVYPPFANPENIPEQYLPPIKKGPVIRIDTGKAKYRWLDIASAPKSSGAPTLNALRHAFNLLLPGKTFELIGTDISFPYFSLLQDGSITESRFVKDGRFLERAHDTENDVTYLNANNSEYDAMKGLAAIEPGSVDFLSISMALHHLYEGEYKRLPFSSLEIRDPGGKLLTNEIMLRMTRKQQEIIDGFLSKLTPGGIFFGNLCCVLFDKRSIREYVDENIDDMFFIVQRGLSSKGFTFFASDPVLFRPNADIYSPQTESMFIRGKQSTVEYFTHPGIASIYPDENGEFYVKVEALFARTNKVVAAHQGWKMGAWGSAAAVIEGIKQAKKVPELLALYLRHVPDEDPIKAVVLEEARELERSTRR